MTIQNKKDNRSSVLKLLLLITNVVLIVYTMIFAFSYSRNIKEEKENQLKEKLFNNEVLSFHYKNAKNEKCYWYYSVFERMVFIHKELVMEKNA